MKEFANFQQLTSLRRVKARNPTLQDFDFVGFSFRQLNQQNEISESFGYPLDA